MKMTLGAIAGKRARSTWNPLDKHADITLSNFNLTASGTAANRIVRSTASRTAGKLYAEVTYNISGGDANAGAGIGNSSASLADSVGGGDANAIGYNAGGSIQKNGSVGSQASYDAGDVIGIFADFTLGLVWFSKNGTFAGDPVAGTDGYSISGMGALFLVANPRDGSMTLNVGGSGFAHSVPSGGAAWG